MSDSSLAETLGHSIGRAETGSDGHPAHWPARARLFDSTLGSANCFVNSRIGPNVGYLPKQDKLSPGIPMAAAFPQPGKRNEKATRRWPQSLIDMVRPTRFERATPAFGGQYSIQLSYGREVAMLSDRGPGAPTPHPRHRPSRCATEGLNRCRQPRNQRGWRGKQQWRRCRPRNWAIEALRAYVHRCCKGLERLNYHSNQLKCGVNRAQPDGAATTGH